jgi:uncharacterized protein (DUF58 family)
VMTESSCFDSDFLAKLECLSLVSRKAFRGSMLGHRRSSQTGGGLEFVDHREYAGADDFRYLDWNLFARQERLMVKRFEEDKELHVYFLLDCSRSMGMGQPPKFDYARRLTAALAYIALADLDRVAVTAFSGELGAEFPPARGKDCALELLHFLDGLNLGTTATDLAHAAAAFTARTKRKGLVLVVSDWFDRAGFRRALDLLRYHGHEVHAIQVIDPIEAEPRMLGDFELMEIERGARRKITISERSLARYRQLFREFCDGLRSYCIGQGVVCTQASTALPLDSLMLKMMRSAGALR